MEIGDVHTLPGSRPLPPEQEADRSSRTTLQADAPDSAETAQPADSPPVSPIDPNEDQRPHQPSTSHNGQNIVLKTEPQTIDKTMPHKHASYTKLVVDWWFWELVGAIVSILALASIVIVLLVYDGNGMPKLPRDVTVGVPMFKYGLKVCSLMPTAQRHHFRFSNYHKRLSALGRFQRHMPDQMDMVKGATTAVRCANVR